MAHGEASDMFAMRLEMGRISKIKPEDDPQRF
jgi:hypothetical protein